MDLGCGWSGSIDEFLHISVFELLDRLQHHHESCMNASASQSQIAAWKSTYDILRSELSILVSKGYSANDWSIIFEYELPRERGRRPDVIILGPEIIFVIEFKESNRIIQAHIDQVAAYARDLKNYHAMSHQYPIIPLLLPTKISSFSNKIDDVWIIAADNLATTLLNSVPNGSRPLIPKDAWINADYEPLPSLIDAARRIFMHQKLPQIRRALSAGIPETIEALNKIALTARANHERHLALITGVPGAGKTLVGIQFVYENSLIESDKSKNAVFLSGNGPLVQVLQHALGSTVFVQDVHGFLKHYGGSRKRTPTEHIWIYDEAQRAWDAERVLEKRGHSTSEPEDFLNIGERMDSWALMVALIGEGQEIHLGEESGLGQWNDAIRKMKMPWIVHCPSKIASQFNAAERIVINPALDLNITLRTHLAEDLSSWIEALFEGDFSQAHQYADRLRAQGFDMYLTNHLPSATDYVKERYQGQMDKRFGFIASSRAKILPRYGIHNEFNYTKTLKVGPWYNDPPTSPFSCCALRDVATEFSCQGLELDYPIICWGEDFVWELGEWKSPKPGGRSKARDPHRLRMNSYRVLLSRGRDGFIIFVPPEPKMMSTYQALKSAGMRELVSYYDAIKVGETINGIA